MSPLARVLFALVRGYQLAVSPWLMPSCRFEPSCSEYAAQAVREHGGVRGGWLALRRLARCHPFCHGGFDPVPPRRARRQPARPRATLDEQQSRIPETVSAEPYRTVAAPLPVAVVSRGEFEC